VNGGDIRNSIDIDFTLGNHYKSGDGYVPKKQVWIDDSAKGLDRKALIEHEMTELKHMGHGIGYPMAHALATKAEKRVRERKSCNFA
jgi:hypothetical protein